MRSKASGVGLSFVLAVLGGSCGGGSRAPGATEFPSVTSVETDGDVEASGRLTKQRWIVQDGCDDGRGARVRLIDFTPGGGQFPAQGFWRLQSGTRLNRVIACERGHRICLGAVQDPPPGLVWGVGMRGDRPCRFPNKCCYPCDTFAHSLRLSCKARTSPSLGEIDGEILEDDEAAFE